MRFKINYGGKTAYDPKDFSRGKFECKAVFQTRKGMPVVVSHSTDPDYDYWKVEYDFACVVFAEYQDALDFCAGRFFDPDGKPVKAVRACAQEESLSASENQKWRIRKNFEEGKPWNGTMLGYRYHNGTLVIEPGEAEIVRRIFREYLSGKGVATIANGLNADGIVTRYGNQWHKRSVTCVLLNYAYTGNLLLQTTFRENHLTKRSLPNDGQLPKYHAKGTHEPIISMANFWAAQAEMEKRSAKHAPKGKNYAARYPFSGLIVCGNCGKHYRRKVTASGPVWICSTFNQQGKVACASKQIPEPALLALTADMDLSDLTEICAENGNRLVFRFKDGSESVKRWQDRSRAESWTPEMREAARQKALERSRKNG